MPLSYDFAAFAQAHRKRYDNAIQFGRTRELLVVDSGAEGGARYRVERERAQVEPICLVADVLRFQAKRENADANEARQV